MNRLPPSLGSSIDQARASRPAWAPRRSLSWTRRGEAAYLRYFRQDQIVHDVELRRELCGDI